MSQDSKVPPLKVLNARQASIITTMLFFEGADWPGTIAFISALDEGLDLQEDDAIQMFADFKSKFGQIKDVVAATGITVPDGMFA